MRRHAQHRGLPPALAQLVAGELLGGPVDRCAGATAWVRPPKLASCVAAAACAHTSLPRLRCTAASPQQGGPQPAAAARHRQLDAAIQRCQQARPLAACKLGIFRLEALRSLVWFCLVLSGRLMQHSLQCVARHSSWTCNNWQAVHGLPAGWAHLLVSPEVERHQAALGMVAAHLRAQPHFPHPSCRHSRLPWLLPQSWRQSWRQPTMGGARTQPQQAVAEPGNIEGAGSSRQGAHAAANATCPVHAHAASQRNSRVPACTQPLAHNHAAAQGGQRPLASMPARS